MAFDYVKFRRGSTDAFSALNPKDPNTLYFVYENPAAKKGLLYLGDKLIGGGKFSELTDVDTENAQPGDILVYVNIGTEQEPEYVWQAMDPERLPLIPDDAVLPDNSNLAPGDTLSEAIMKLDEAIGDIADTDSWRPIYVEGVEELTNSIDSGYVNFAAGVGIALAAANGTINISIDAQALAELVEDIIVPYNGDEPGLVPKAPETDSQDPSDVPGNYVLAGDGTWINITNLGPFWEDLTGVVIPDFTQEYPIDLNYYYIGTPLEVAEGILDNMGIAHTAVQFSKGSRPDAAFVVVAQDAVGYYEVAPESVELTYKIDEPHSHIM